jgi:glutathione S-transferase
MPHIEIVSHPLCPHAHRLVLIATAKGWQRDKDFKGTYLPYATLQQTVPQHSPTGELPILKVDGELRSTNPMHAAEYLDGVTGLGLVPSDASTRLTVRERESKVGALLDMMRTMFAGPTSEIVKGAVDGVFDRLDAFDAELARDDTTETTMRMDMAALEPALVLLWFFPVLRDHPRWARIPRLHGIARRSIENPWIKMSMCPNYGREFDEFFKMTNSAFPKAFAV